MRSVSKEKHIAREGKSSTGDPFPPQNSEFHQYRCENVPRLGLAWSISCSNVASPIVAADPADACGGMGGLGTGAMAACTRGVQSADRTMDAMKCILAVYHCTGAKQRGRLSRDLKFPGRLFILVHFGNKNTTLLHHFEYRIPVCQVST